MISRHAGAPPSTPETPAPIASPSKLPTHTATVKRSVKPMHQLSRRAFDVPVLTAAQNGSASALSEPKVEVRAALSPIMSATMLAAGAANTRRSGGTGPGSTLSFDHSPPRAKLR